MKETQSQYSLAIEEEEDIDIKKIFFNYFSYWRWFVLSIVICLAASFIYLRYSPNIYETTSKIKILGEEDSFDLPLPDMLVGNAKVNLENEIAVLTSYPIFEKVVQDLQLNFMFKVVGKVRARELDFLPFTFIGLSNEGSVLTQNAFEVDGTKASFEIYNTETDELLIFPNHDTSLIAHELPFQLKIESQEQLEFCLDKTYRIEVASTRDRISALKEMIEVKPGADKNSEIVTLSSESEVPSKSERVINAIVEAFNQDGIRDRQLISKRTLAFIDDRFMFLSNELDSIELGKKEYKQDNNLVYIEADSQLSLQRSAQANEEVFRIENQLALSQLLEEAIDDSNTNSGLLPANIGIESSTINALIEVYNNLIIESEKLKSSGGLNNPMVRQLQIQLEDLSANIDRSLEESKKQLLLSQKQLLKREKNFESDVYNLPEKEKLLRAINRQQTIKETLFVLLLQKREEAAISLAVTEPSIKVVEYALSSIKPIAPKSKIIVLVGLLLGLLLPFGFLYIVFLLDDKIHGKEDVINNTNDIPVVGEIPLIKDSTMTVFNSPDDRSVLAESFRIFSSNVKFLLPPKEEGKGAVIFTTSSIKGEGKTFISLNLSLALSSLNKKVLLIGSDLRNPQLHTYLNIDKDKAGLSNYLHNPEVDWKDNLISGFAEHPGHQILISGQIPPNPPHLLTNGHFETLLEEAKLLFDYIVVDTAPTISVTDTLLISSFADATVYLTRANYTEKKLLNHAMDLSKQKKLKNMAIVINSVGNSKKSGYGYNYGYGYGYGEDS